MMLLIHICLPELRSFCTRVELTEAVTKPLKESAGKSLLDVGQRFGGWMRRLFSSHACGYVVMSVPVV